MRELLGGERFPPGVAICSQQKQAETLKAIAEEEIADFRGPDFWEHYKHLIA
jgi:hypothetical protein